MNSSRSLPTCLAAGAGRLCCRLPFGRRTGRRDNAGRCGSRRRQRSPHSGSPSPNATPAPTPDLAETRSTRRAPSPQFTPPFPDASNCSSRPKRAQSTRPPRRRARRTVELKGFINVDKPRVVLSIDGVISPVPEGGEKYGVQVISIQPPTVVLQRGRNRWTATLE